MGPGDYISSPHLSQHDIIIVLAAFGKDRLNELLYSFQYPLMPL